MGEVKLEVKLSEIEGDKEDEHRDSDSSDDNLNADIIMPKRPHAHYSDMESSGPMPESLISPVRQRPEMSGSQSNKSTKSIFARFANNVMAIADDVDGVSTK